MKRSLIPTLLYAPDATAAGSVMPAQEGGDTRSIEFVNPPDEDPAIVKAREEETKAAADREKADQERFAKLKPDELESQRQSFIDKIFPDGSKQPEQAPALTDEEKKAAEDKAAADKLAADKKVADDKAAADKAAADKKGGDDTKEGKKKRSKAATAAIDAQQIKDAVVEGTKTAVQAIADKMTAPAPAKPAEVDPELDANEKETLEILKVLENVDPKYKGLTDKTQKFWKKEATYAEKWEKENEGKTFDPDAEEHAAWYEKNGVDYEPDDFKRAERQLIEQRVTEKVKSETSKTNAAELRKIQLERDYERALPHIQNSSHRSATELLAQALPEFKAAMTVDGNLVLNEEIVKKLDAIDPDALDILMRPQEELRILINELETISRFPGDYRIDPNLRVPLKTAKASIYPHREILDFSNQLEQELLTLDPAETTRKDGRKLISDADLQRREKAIQQAEKPEDAKAKIQELRSQFYTVDSNMIRTALIAQKAADAGEIISRLQKRGKVAAPAADKPAAKADEKKDPPAADTTDDGKPPTTTGGSDKTDTSKPGTQAGTLSEEQLESKMGWR